MDKKDKNLLINQALSDLRGMGISDLSKLRALERLFDSAYALGKAEQMSQKESKDEADKKDT